MLYYKPINTSKFAKPSGITKLNQCLFFVCVYMNTIKPDNYSFDMFGQNRDNETRLMKSYIESNVALSISLV